MRRKGYTDDGIIGVLGFCLALFMAGVFAALLLFIALGGTLG